MMWCTKKCTRSQSQPGTHCGFEAHWRLGIYTAVVVVSGVNLRKAHNGPLMDLMGGLEASMMVPIIIFFFAGSGPRCLCIFAEVTQNHKLWAFAVTFMFASCPSTYHVAHRTPNAFSPLPQSTC